MQQPSQNLMIHHFSMVDQRLLATLDLVNTWDKDCLGNPDAVVSNNYESGYGLEFACQTAIAKVSCSYPVSDTRHPAHPAINNCLEQTGDGRELIVDSNHIIVDVHSTEH